MFNDYDILECASCLSGFFDDGVGRRCACSVYCRQLVVAQSLRLCVEMPGSGITVRDPLECPMELNRLPSLREATREFRLPSRGRLSSIHILLPVVGVGVTRADRLSRRSVEIPGNSAQCHGEEQALSSERAERCSSLRAET